MQRQRWASTDGADESDYELGALKEELTLRSCRTRLEGAHAGKESGADLMCIINSGSIKIHLPTYPLDGEMSSLGDGRLLDNGDGNTVGSVHAFGDGIDAAGVGVEAGIRHGPQECALGSNDKVAVGLADQGGLIAVLHICPNRGRVE